MVIVAEEPRPLVRGEENCHIHSKFRLSRYIPQPFTHFEIRIISKLAGVKRADIFKMSCDLRGPEENSSCLQS
jgi:hypothetical protein